MSDDIRTGPMKSAAGWYLGQEYYDTEIEAWLPYDRLTGYTYSKWEVVLSWKNGVIGDARCEAIDEVEAELVQSRKNKHVLGPVRTEFLEHVLDAFRGGYTPVWKWNYALDAVPENAIIGKED